MDESVITTCTTCGEETEHAVLKAGDTNVTVQCQECFDVHTFSPPRLRLNKVRLVVSHGDESWSDFLETPSDEEIAVGFEFELDGHRMLVTGIETTTEGKHAKARAADIRVVQAIVFDEVALKLSLNEKEVTHSFELNVDPDQPVHVGEVYEVGGRRMAVKTLKSDQNRTLHKGFLLARNVRRAFCDPAPESARVGDIVGVRRRGAPPERKGQAPSSRVKAPNAVKHKPRKR